MHLYIKDNVYNHIACYKFTMILWHLIRKHFKKHNHSGNFSLVQSILPGMKILMGIKRRISKYSIYTTSS